jgi:hypothetical protein
MSDRSGWDSPSGSCAEGVQQDLLLDGITSSQLSVEASKNRGGRKRGQVKARSIVNAAMEISAAPPQVDEIVWGAKCMVSASLPLREPKPEHLKNGCWVRKNGDQTLWIQGGPLGLPYGAYPRLLTYWLTTEAIRTGKRSIETGGSFVEFCRKIGIDSSRGKNGAGGRFLHQANLLIQSRAAVIKGDFDVGRMSGEILQFTEKFNLLFDPIQSSHRNLFDMEILLTEQFFQEITMHSIPLDQRAVVELRQSALQLDIYQWLTYRMYALRRPAYPTWKQLREQFGSQTKRMVDFRVAFLAALHAVMQVYPRVNVKHNELGLALYPSPTPVPPGKSTIIR